jgi:release factor glutamine methyltransferase
MVNRAETSGNRCFAAAKLVPPETGPSVKERFCAGQMPRAAQRAAIAALVRAGCPDAAFDARELVRAATGADPLLSQTALTPAQARTLESLTARRAAREPLQYLVGEWDFLDFTLRVGPGVLCPRADTETVCEAALDRLKSISTAAPLVLDLCAGTGCLGLGIRRFAPRARVICVEKSPDALAYLKQNAAALAPFGISAPAVEVVQGDINAYFSTLQPQSVDLIVSNPPYLTGVEMGALMPETAFEPAMALDGGMDGLAFYRILLREYRACLRPEGWMVLEIGYQQRYAVTALGTALGWQNISCRRDAAGHDRALLLQRTGKPLESDVQSTTNGCNLHKK